MTKTNLEFFATPEEELLWLRELLSDDRLWCVVKKFPPNRLVDEVTGTRFLKDLALSRLDESGGLQLYFGRKDFVSSPIWRTTEAGERDFDFTQSQAILFDPSVLVAEHILLQGQIAIMRRGFYQDAGIDPKPVQHWFRELANSFSKFKAGGTVFVRDPSDGIENPCPYIIATPGAVKWQRSGRLLKQFVKGAYEFIVRLEN